MGWEAWFTLAVVAGTVVVLAANWLSPGLTMVGASVALVGAGVIDLDQGLSGFSNPAPFTIAGLYVVARAVQRSGALDPAMGWMLQRGAGLRSQLARLVVPTAVASGFLNNTPIVAMLIGPVEQFSASERVPASRYLMPISFAAILGGSVTLVGTATNLVVSGLLVEDGYDAIGFFEISTLGVPVAVVGIITLLVLAPKLVPDRGVAPTVAEFTADLLVTPGGPLEGATVRSAGLRNLEGTFLAELRRDDETIAPVGPQTRLRADDLLRFVGRASDMARLHDMPGLASTAGADDTAEGGDGAAYFEVVIGKESRLVGRTLRDSGFRSRYQAAVIAIQRAGEQIDAQLGRVELLAGDTLIVTSDEGFAARWQDRPDFLLITPQRPTTPRPTTRGRTFAVIGAVVVAGILLEMPLTVAVLIMAVGLVVVRAMTASEARSAVDLDVILTIAAAFGVAAAIQASGLADTATDGIVGLFGGLGSAGVLIGVLVATSLLKEFITTNAAALLMFPIAVSAAIAAGGNPRGYAIAVAIAASKSFLTPIGYQTNTMVYGPGKYRYGDYVRLGVPLTVLTLAAVVILEPVFFP